MIFNWISNGFTLVFYWNFNCIFNEFQFLFHWKFNLIYNGFPFRFHWNFNLIFIEVSIGFPLDFHWRFILNRYSLKWQLDFHLYFIVISIKFQMPIWISIKLPISYFQFMHFVNEKSQLVHNPVSLGNRSITLMHLVNDKYAECWV